MRLITLLVLFGVAACAPQKPVVQTKPNAESMETVLYTNATFWTGANTPPASMMVVSDGRIGYVGDGTTVRIAADRTVDLGGRFVMPGFIDNHVHFLYGGAGLASVQLRDADSREVFVDRIAAFAAKISAGQWVLNGDWDHTLWGGELPHKNWIDGVTGDTPVFVMRLDGHLALANSAALKLAGVTAATKTPQGGEIQRDARGEPTGIIKDTALDLFFAAIPAPAEKQILQSLDLAQDHALSLGIVKVHDMSASIAEADSVDVFMRAHELGRLRLRVQGFSHLGRLESVAERLASHGRGDAMLNWPGVKGFVDGSLGASTAWFHEPYEGSRNRGFPLSDMDQLARQISAADAAGLRLAIHAIGDRAIDDVIAILRSLGGDDIASRRYRIEHFQHPTAEAIRAAADSGIIASVQPFHAIDDGRWAEERIGHRRATTTYAFRSILDAGGRLSFGSDWPVAPLSPLDGVYAAVTRRTTDGANPDGWQPQEKITVEEALSAYTLGNAYAAFEENETGSLSAGKRADFVVLSDDPRQVGHAALRDIKVLQTVIDGKVMFSR